MDVAELQALRTFEGGSDAVGDIAVGIGIPRGAPLWVVVAELFKLVDLAAIDDQFEGEGIFAVGVVLVFGLSMVIPLR